MVVTSLVLANPSTDAPVSDERFGKLLREFDPSVHPIPLKLTLIIVNNTLVQQWHDEIVRFAPGLKVHVFYADASKKAQALSQLREADVLITTPHMTLPNELARKMSVHRLIMDEAHLLAHGSTTHSKLKALSQYMAARKWCVTGTPFSTSLEQLKDQAELIGHYDGGIKVHEFLYGRPRPNWTPPPPRPGGYSRWQRQSRPLDKLSNEAIVELLRAVMIRHTKSMRIGGEVALALPDADCTTAWLDMSADEKLLYELHHCVEPGISMAATRKLEACSHLYDTSVVCGAAYELEHIKREVLLREMVAEGRNPDERSLMDSQEGMVQRATLQKELAERIRARFGETPPSLDQPLQLGAIPAAAAAFWRSHDKVAVVPKAPTAKMQKLIDQGRAAAPAKHAWQAKATLTKFAALLSDLAALRADEPDMRAVVFTRHDLVQERLVALITNELRPGGKLATPHGARALKLFEFNKLTAPTKRHKLIKDFQDQGSAGPRVFIVTYATAAVGITLTAANRVFLMEPCIDPGMEAQARGHGSTSHAASPARRPLSGGCSCDSSSSSAAAAAAAPASSAHAVRSPLRTSGGGAHPPARSDEGHFRQAVCLQGHD
jgi:hypothetical protein